MLVLEIEFAILVAVVLVGLIGDWWFWGRHIKGD